MASIRVLELRRYLLKKFKEECKKQGVDAGWTTERAVHFCTELQGLDRSMLELLYDKVNYPPINWQACKNLS